MTQGLELHDTYGTNTCIFCWFQLFFLGYLWIPFLYFPSKWRCFVLLYLIFNIWWLISVLDLDTHVTVDKFLNKKEIFKQLLRHVQGPAVDGKKNPWKSKRKIEQVKSNSVPFVYRLYQSSTTCCLSMSADFQFRFCVILLIPARWNKLSKDTYNTFGLEKILWS